VSTIGDLVDRQAEIGDNVALVIGPDRLTYPELSYQSDRFAASLIALGVERGDKVGILMHNCLTYVLALLGTAKIGAIAVPINGRFKTEEAGYIISHADVKVLLTGSDPRGTDYPALVSAVFADGGDPARRRAEIAPDLTHIVSFTSQPPGFMSAAEFYAAGESVPTEEVKIRQSRVRVRDIALLMYTSGTTARPKGCLLTHEALTRQGEKVAVTRFELTRSDAIWDPLPLFHCGGIVPMLGAFSQGAKYCHPGHFDATEALRTISAERCTVLYPAFEAIWQPIINHPDFEKTDLSFVRIIQNIATPERLAQYEQRMPWAAQVSSYGSTESATNLTMSRRDDPLEVRLNTVGRVVDGMEIKIVDPETGERVPDGTMGELCFRGYSMFEGYYKDPEQTAKSIDDEGFFHTGDRAMIRPDGNLVYGGRLKDMLKVGGENVAAIEIEDYLARHPGVRVVQVVGVPDARLNEVPAAFIERAPGVEVTEQEIIDFCVGKIASYKVPRYVRFVTEWPMSGTKVKKFELRNSLIAELEAAGITEAPPVRSLATQASGDTSARAGQTSPA
jgi:fatty-acyl-CoA synthase